MLRALKEQIGGECKCLTQFKEGQPLKPPEEDMEDLTYEVCLRSRALLFSGGAVVELVVLGVTYEVVGVVHYVLQAVGIARGLCF